MLKIFRADRKSQTKESEINQVRGSLLKDQYAAANAALDD